MATTVVTPGSVPDVVPAASPTAPTTEEIQVAVPGQETVEAPAEVVEEVEQDVDLDAIPETSGDFSEYKPLFKDKPELRSILGREKAFSELQGGQSWQEFRQIHELIPTLADAESLQEQAQAHRQFMETFSENPTEALDRLRESDGNAYKSLLRTIPEVLAEQDLDTWAEHARYYVNHTLTRMGQMFPNDESVQNALSVLASKGMYGNPQSRTDSPRQVSEATRLRKQLEERDQQDKDKAFTSFQTSVSSDFQNTMVKEIEDGVRKSLPNANQSTLNILVPRIWEKLNGILGQQPQTRAQAEKMFADARKGRMSSADLKQVIDFSVRRGKLSLPGVLKSELKEWTAAAVTTNNAKVDKQKQIANATRDAGSGASASTSASNNTPKKRETSDDVWKKLESRTYQKPA